MVQLRSSRTPKFKASLALLNANRDPRAFERHATIPTYIEGCERGAAKQGYSLDRFWLHDPELTATGLARIMRNRNIRGGIIVGMMAENQLPPRFSTLWKQFPFVVTGVRTHSPTLSFTCTDHHALTLEAVERALHLGYRRPALVLDHVIDNLVEGRFTSGFLFAQQRIPLPQRTNPFYLVNESRTNVRLFSDWLKEEKPDVILSLYFVVQRWLTELGYQAPRNMGLISLEWRRDHPDWAGMNQHNDTVGETAVEMIIGMIHRGVVGLPPFPQATLMGGSWVNGATLPPKKSPVSRR